MKSQFPHDSFWQCCRIVEKAIAEKDVSRLSYEAYRHLREPFTNAESAAQEMAQKEMKRLAQIGAAVEKHRDCSEDACIDANEDPCPEWFDKLKCQARLGAAVAAMPPGTVLEHESSGIMYKGGPSWRVHRDMDPRFSPCCGYGGSPMGALEDAKLT